MDSIKAAGLARIGHRVSGVALAVFLPLHFYVLGLVLTNSAALDSALVFGEQWAVRVLEWMLVALLSIHLTFGLRVLVIEAAARRNDSQPANMRYWWLPGGLVLAVIVASAYLIAAG